MTRPTDSAIVKMLKELFRTVYDQKAEITRLNGHMSQVVDRPEIVDRAIAMVLDIQSSEGYYDAEEVDRLLEDYRKNYKFLK
jgi:hypothetical protein